MTTEPDIFTSVHRGIRLALFDVILALGRVDGAVPAALRADLRAALAFVRHHGENEDLLLLPLLATRAPEVHARMRDAHAGIDVALEALLDRVVVADAAALFHGTCDFTARYLAHMAEEELELEPAIRRAVSTGELAEVPRAALARTPTEDARRMLAWMLAAMPPRAAAALRSKLPFTVEDHARRTIT